MTQGDGRAKNSNLPSWEQPPGDVSCCGCSGEWPQGGSGVTDMRQLYGQRKAEVPGAMHPPVPRGQGEDGQVGQLCPEDGP